MALPQWLRVVLGAAMIAVTLVHLRPFVGPGQAGRAGSSVGSDVTHALMGAVMALILAGSIDARAGAALAMVFAVPLVWFLCRGVRTFVLDGPRAAGEAPAQVIGCAAMVYMLGALGSGVLGGGVLGTSSMATMAGPPGAVPGSLPVLVLVLATAAVGISTLGRLRIRPAIAGAHPSTLGCRLAVSVTTVVMLATM